MRIFLVLIFLLALCGTAVKLTKHTFEDCLPVSLLAIPVVYWLSQFIFHTFLVALIVLTAAAVAIVPLLIPDLIRSGRTEERRKDAHQPDFLQNFCTEGLLFFLILFAFFVFHDWNRSFTLGDEFSHWGKFVKEMLRTDHWYSEPAAHVLYHKDYPPFASLFELFWCQVSGGWSESGALLALHILEMSLLVKPAAELTRAVCGSRALRAEQTENTCGSRVLGAEQAGDTCGSRALRAEQAGNNSKGEKILRICRILLFDLVLLAAILLVIRVFDGEPSFNTIYTDIFLSLLAVYGFALIRDIGAGTGVRSRADEKAENRRGEDIFTFAALTLCCIALLQTKQVGIAFACLMWLGALLTLISRRDRTAKRRTAILYCGVIVIPLLFSGVWRLYIRSLQIRGQFDLSRISVTAIRSILQGGDPAYNVQRWTAAKYASAILRRTILNTRLPVSYVTFFLIAAFAVWLIHRLLPACLNRQQCIRMEIIVLIGTAGYALMMGILYLFCFPEDQMLNLDCYQRYMSCYALAETGMILQPLRTWVCMKADRQVRTDGQVRIDSPDQADGQDRPGEPGRPAGSDRTAKIRHWALSLAALCGGCLCWVALTGSSNADILLPARLFNVDTFRPMEQIAEKIEDNTEGERSVFVLTQDGVGTQFVVNYYLDDAWVNMSDVNYLDAANLAADPENAAEVIFSNDCLYVEQISDAFNEAFADRNGGQPFEAGRLYRIEEGNCSLVQ